MDEASNNNSQARTLAIQWKNRKGKVDKVIGDVYKLLNDPMEVDVLLQDGYFHDYLWAKGDMSTDIQVESAAIFITAMHEKSRNWTRELVESSSSSSSSSSTKFIDLFDRAKTILMTQVNPVLLRFVAVCFANLDSPQIRTLVGPLVSIPIWTCISESYRDSILEENQPLRKQWRGYNKKFEKSDKETQAVMKLQRSWLYTVCVKNLGDHVTVEFIQFLLVLLGQIPTRRYTNTLFKDLSIVPVIYSRWPSNKHPKMVQLLDYYVNSFPINDFTGEALAPNETYQQRCKQIKALQAIAYREFKAELKFLALSNVAGVAEDMDDHLAALSQSQLLDFASKAGVRTEYPFEVPEKFIHQAMKQRFKVPTRGLFDFEPHLPTEHVLKADNSDHSEAQFRPIITTQHLSVHDILIKMYNSCQADLLESARDHISTVLSRVAPEVLTANAAANNQKKRKLESDNEPGSGTSAKLKLNGTSKYAARIHDDPVVVKIVHPSVGKVHPSLVQVEASVELSNTADWQANPGDLVYLVQYGQYGVMKLRSGIIAEDDSSGKGRAKGKSIHRVLINVDPRWFPAHESANPEFRIIQDMNLVIRSRVQLSAVFGLIKRMSTRDSLPEWANDVLLGLSSSTEHDEGLDRGDNDDDGSIESIAKTLGYSSSASRVRFTSNQLRALIRATRAQLCTISSPPYAGKSELAAQLVNMLHSQQQNGAKTLIMTPGNCSELVDKIATFVPALDIFKVDENFSDLHDDISKPEAAAPSGFTGTLAHALSTRAKLLHNVDQIAASREESGAHGDSCETAEYFFKSWGNKNNGKQAGDDLNSEQELVELRHQLQVLRPVEMLSSSGEAQRYLLRRAKVVVMDARYNQALLGELGGYDNLVLYEAGKLDFAESILPVLSQASQEMKKVVVIGDEPQRFGLAKQLWNSSQVIELTDRFGVRPEMARLISSSSSSSSSITTTNTTTTTQDEPAASNAGFAHNAQVITTEQASVEVQAGIYQNQEQAEYAVALFKYMRLLGYPSEEIAIVTSSIGQKILIEKLVQEQCSSDKIFGLPRKVATDGEWLTGHCDYVIATLVSPSRDILSRAKLGLYVLSSCSSSSDHLLSELHCGNLSVITNELYGQSNRHTIGSGIEMHGLEHFMQYVQEMTTQRRQYDKKKAQL